MTEKNDGAKTRRQPKGGSRKGIPNRTTAALKEAILLAAADVGQDGKGKDGLRGYLRRVAMKDTKSFAALLGKVLPLTVAGDADNPIAVEIVRFGQDPAAQ